MHAGLFPRKSFAAALPLLASACATSREPGHPAFLPHANLVGRDGRVLGSISPFPGEAMFTVRHALAGGPMFAGGRAGTPPLPLPPPRVAEDLDAAVFLPADGSPLPAWPPDVPDPSKGDAIGRPAVTSGAWVGRRGPDGRRSRTFPSRRGFPAASCGERTALSQAWSWPPWLPRP